MLHVDQYLTVLTNIAKYSVAKPYLPRYNPYRPCPPRFSLTRTTVGFILISVFLLAMSEFSCYIT